MRTELQDALAKLPHPSYRIALQATAAEFHLTVEQLVEGICGRTRYMPANVDKAVAKLTEEMRTVIFSFVKGIGAMALPPRIVVLTGGAKMHDHDTFVEAVAKMIPDDHLPCRVELVDNAAWLCVRHIGTTQAMKTVVLAPEMQDQILSMLSLPKPAAPRKPAENSARDGEVSP